MLLVTSVLLLGVNAKQSCTVIDEGCVCAVETCTGHAADQRGTGAGEAGRAQGGIRGHQGAENACASQAGEEGGVQGAGGRKAVRRPLRHPQSGSCLRLVSCTRCRNTSWGSTKDKGLL